ncbi:MAG: flagellar hook-basal body complex protein [Provencibacterium sp.]|jgi:flagellar basal-body rod protein FlgF|nr:flagellar hook-basal body complex protein [Provencibacterium sp.]
MLEGFYIAASGMLTQQRTINVLANNMANVKTPGYKARRVLSETFEQELLIRMEKNNTQVIGAGEATRIVRDVATDFGENLLEETGRPFDMALVGPGYFNIQGENNQYLTRNGNFDVDTEGYLILEGAGRVLGEDGEIEVGGSYFTVSEDGVVMDSEGSELGRLLITDPQAAGNGEQEGAADLPLVQQANGLYTVTEGVENTPATGYSVYQKVLERPNLDLNREYTLVMEAQRSFQSCANALKIIDGINQKTATQIASIG